MQKDFYQRQIEELQNRLSQNSKQRIVVGTIRLIAFVLTIYSIYLYASQHNKLWLIGTLLGLVCFFVLVKTAGNLLAKKELLEALLKVNENELRALKGEWVSEATGSVFMEENHPYALDFDLFGERSLFAWINRGYTWLGQKMLANWLMEPQLDNTTIRDRQLAVDELSSKLEFRQLLSAHGMVKKTSEEDYQKTDAWLQKPGVFKNTKILKLLFAALALIMVACTSLAFLEFLPFGYYIYIAIISLGITGIFLKKVNLEYLQASKSLETLQLYRSFFALMKDESFETPWLKSKQQDLLSEEGALENIKSLTRLIEAFDNRNNMIMGVVLNLILFWDLNCVLRIADWKKKNQNEFQDWFKNLGEIEAACSLANIRYNRPEWTFPEMSTKEYTYEFTAMGHPFIDENSRVDNNFSIDKLGSFSIITGANMAGKSTFLRALGVNMILAMAGSVVCAKAMKFKPIELFSSMRTVDSLQDEASYFFSELSRLKALIHQLDQEKPTFIILDEILKGTNSKDKASGSKAFVKNIVNKNAIGAIATHDLSLCSLEQDLPGKIDNYSFEVEFDQDDLVFDYTLRKGICQNMNASFLMRKMGIIPEETT